MTSYYDDEPPYRPQGQAAVPGAGGYDPHTAYESATSSDFDPFAAPHNDPYAAPAAPPPPAPTGRATVGRSSVRPAGGYDEYAPQGGYEDYAPVGGYDGAVPDPNMHDGFDPFSPDSPPPAFDPFAPEGPAQPVGRASVSPVSPPSGRATVGRASVGVPGGPGGPTGPGGPGGPGSRGPGGGAKGKSSPAAKKRRRRNRILAALATVIMLSGVLVVAVTYYAASIPTPENIVLPQSTVLQYSNGKFMAQIGTTTRTIVPLTQVPKPVQNAVVATEDDTFYTNSGIDVKGIARALVNNVSGGSTQGASTITQQYARTVVQGVGTSDTYSRKLKEAVTAVKLTQHYSKDYILGAYLNSVPFGRGAYGIQAAAQAYFAKDVGKLTQAEGMVLADLIKDPNGNKYDPACKCASAQTRFQYSREQLLKGNFITQAQYAALVYPTDWIKPLPDYAANQGIATPQGFIVHHVMSELSAMKNADGTAKFPTGGPNSLLNGGYTIKTTINQAAQAAAVKAAGAGTGSPVKGVYGVVKQKKSSQIASALVAVEPGTGRVLAYYGGQSGANLDFGGIYTDPVMTDGTPSGQHVTPGSTFKTITMATALSQNISIDSQWYGPASRKFKGRTQPVTNSAADACPTSNHYCTMWKALQKSTNTVYYEIGQVVHPDKVVDMAQALGINNLWSDSRCGGKIQPLTANNGSSVYPKCIGGEIAFGQFGVAVQDVANVMATFANHGVKANEHFVESVTQGFDKRKIVPEQLVLTPVPGLTPQKVDDETWSMQQVFTNHDEIPNQLDGNRQAAVKTGTWQLGDSPDDAAQSSQAMFNGFTAGTPEQGQIAASVWVGYSNDPMAVFTSSGKKMAGALTPAQVWKQFVDAYEKGKPIEQFAPAAHTGNPQAGETPPVAPTPSTPPPVAPGGPGCLPTGCQQPPQSQGPPPPPSPLTIAANVNGTLAILNWDNSGGGNGHDGVQIDWGDGSTQTVGGSQTQKSHNYTKPGNYTITVTDANDGSRSANKTVTIN